MDGIVWADLNKDIVITAGDTPGTQKVVFKATTELDKAKLSAAMGAKKTRFVVTKVTEKGKKEKKEDKAG